MTTTAQLNAALAGRYTIERELGAGGMATVYLAHDVRHDRKVALKVLRPELSAILGAERFLAEIKTTANLQHPHILSLFDSGEADGTVFYVMPYVVGESLRDRIRREQQLPIDDAVRIAREVLDALEYAHQHGIVHRDIKPENILLHGGHAMVADFGIALAASKVEGGTRMTETGMSLGTPHYMSPEQAMGERTITGKADIYALGAVLYEMLTGEPPFTGQSAQAVFARVLTDEPRSLTVQRKTVPPHIEAAVHRALQKLPADRFTSATEFAAALNDRTFTTASTRSGVVGVSARYTWQSWSRDPRSWAAMVAAAALAIVSLLPSRADTSSADSRTVRLAVTGPTDSTVLSLVARPGMPIAEPVVSPDGRYVAFSVNRSDGPSLYLRALDSFELREIPGGGHWPFFSDDGSTLGFLRNAEVWSADVTDLTPSRVGVIPERHWDITSVAWHPDGRILFTGAVGLWALPVRGGDPTLLVAADTSAHEQIHTVSLFMDGRILINAMSRQGKRTEVVSRDGKERRSILPGWELVRVVDDVLIFVQAEQTRASRFDAGSLEPTGTPVALPQFTTSLVAPEWSLPPGATGDGQESAVGITRRVGRSIAWRDEVSARELEPVWVSRTGSVTPTGLPRAFYRWPRLSPDGRRMAIGGRVSGGRMRPVVVDLVRRTQTPIAGSTEPVWSADGRWIFASTGNRPLGGLVRQVSDASLPPDTLLRLPIGDAWPTSVSPDGKWLAWYGASVGVAEDADAKDQNDLNFIELATKEVRRVRIAGEQRGARFSPDGKWVAFESTESGRDEVYVRPWPSMDANFLVSSGGGTEPVWSPSGRELYYRRLNHTLVVDFATRGNAVDRSPPRVLFSGVYGRDEYGDQSWDVAPDGRFLMLRPVPGARVEFRVALNWIAEVRAQLDRASRTKPAP